jgi:hypothetical protein
MKFFTLDLTGFAQQLPFTIMSSAAYEINVALYPPNTRAWTGSAVTHLKSPWPR